MRKGDIKIETEGLITTAQEQTPITNSIKAHIDKQDVWPLCRMCGRKEERVLQRSNTKSYVSSGLSEP